MALNSWIHLKVTPVIAQHTIQEGAGSNKVFKYLSFKYLRWAELKIIRITHD